MCKWAFRTTVHCFGVTGVVVIVSSRRMRVTRQCEWVMSKGDDGKQGQPLRLGVSEYSFAAPVNQHSKCSRWSVVCTSSYELEYSP